MIFSGLLNLAKIIQKQVNEEMYDPKKLQQELMDLQLKLEMDEISEEEYNDLEEDILERMEKSREISQEEQ